MTPTLAFLHLPAPPHIVSCDGTLAVSTTPPQRVRLSIGGADARHFHPITREIPSNHGQVSRVEERDGSSSDSRTDLRHAAPAVAEANIAGLGHEASVTRRVLRVHTGGDYASGVSLPVPRNDGGGFGRPGRVVGEETGRGEVFGRAGIGREGDAVDYQGARNNGTFADGG